MYTKHHMHKAKAPHVLSTLGNTYMYTQAPNMHYLLQAPNMHYLLQAPNMHSVCVCVLTHNFTPLTFQRR